MTENKIGRLLDNDGTAVRLWPKTLAEAAGQAASHLARYVFARNYAAGKNVCDIACGAGYGSSYLGQRAQKVVGMDISDDAIAWARKYFGRDNVRFLKADGAEKWPVEDKYDVITSFETMEHIENPGDFLEIIHEHLMPGGVLVLSVPNGPRDKRKTDNPHHLHHFRDSDLKGLIEKYFSNVKYFSQAYRKDIKHYGTKLLRKVKLLRKQPYFVNNYFLLPGFSHNLKTWVVIAHK